VADAVAPAGAVRAGGPGMRVAAATGEVMIPEGESDGLSSSDESVQFESDELEVRDRPP
jgi:1,4-alpha-glucan branching enzyme